MFTVKIPIPQEDNAVLAVTPHKGQICLETRTKDGVPSGQSLIIPDHPMLIARLCQVLLEPHKDRYLEAA